MDTDPHADDPLLRLDPALPFRWLFLDLNSYFASVEQQEDPRLRGRPVGVVPSPGEYTCLIAASIEARPLGLRTGTPVREARRLCPGIVLREARHELYVEYHRRVVAEVERHVPVSRAWSVDEMSVRLLGPQRAPAAARALALAIKAGLRARVGECLRCSIGLAPSRLLAKLATDMQKPDGLVALGPEALPGALLALPLRDFPGIGARLAARLAAAGVADAAALWALGPKRARALWNSVEGERFWYGLRGADLPEPPLRAVPGSLGHARVLPPGLRDAEGARHVIRLLAQKATARLRAAGCVAGAVVLEVVPAEPGEQPRGGGLRGEAPLPGTDDDRTVLAGLEALWRALLARPAAPARFRRVSVLLAGLEAAAGRNGDLFAAPAPRLGAALDAVHRRFGRGGLAIGQAPRDREAFEGAKIAFARVPGLGADLRKDGVARRRAES